jgi:hypothetical protein
MDYCVRLLITSDKVFPFSEIRNQGKWLKLVSGTDMLWERIEICEPEDNPICVLERHRVTPGSQGEAELAELKELLRNGEPAGAREWIRKYFFKIQTLYIFHIYIDNITNEGWRVLGRIQSLLHDMLVGLFYNEDGDFVLWQMYEGASGTIPAAALDEQGRWITYQLKLKDAKAVERFKQGIIPKRSYFDKFLRR